MWMHGPWRFRTSSLSRSRVVLCWLQEHGARPDVRGLGYLPAVGVDLVRAARGELA